MNATKAAIAEGIVAGGGVSLVRVAEKLRAGKKFDGNEEDAGYQIVLRALEAPLRQIAVNAGKGDGSIIVEKVKEMKGNGGYNALSGEFVTDMVTAGIIDPVKVTRSGVEHAASAAAILLTTEVAITDEPKEEKGGGAPDMGGMGY